MTVLHDLHSESLGQKKLRVVLADDHKLLCDVLMGYLDNVPDVEVVGSAHNGRDSIELIQREFPDIALLDYSMPDMTGLQIMEALSDLGNPVKVILVTMHSEFRKVNEALEAGVKGYVLKSSAAQDLVRAIRVVSEGRVYLSEPLITDVVTDYLELRADRQDKSPLSLLSDREKEVLKMQAEGVSTREIASLLHLSPKTVETYKYRVKSKLDIADNAGLVKFAIRSKLISLD